MFEKPKLHPESCTMLWALMIQNYNGNYVCHSVYTSVMQGF